MNFLIDNQLPRALAIHLRTLGHDCVHVLDLNLSTSDDSEIWEFAKTQDRIVVSKDEDFIFLANRPNETGRLVWVRLGNCRNVALIAAFDRIHDQLVHTFATGQRIVELR